MLAIVEILRLHGGLETLGRQPIKIEVPGFMPLSLEIVGRGPNRQILISVAHYHEQNGDLMADPEMTFEVSKDGWESPDLWAPVTYTQHSLGIFQEAVFRTEDDRVMIHPTLIKNLRAFARQWSRNLKSQGFVRAYGETMRARAAMN